MPEQLRLEGTEVPRVLFRPGPAAVLVGRAGIAECRAILAAAAEKSQKSLDG